MSDPINEWEKNTDYVEAIVQSVFEQSDACNSCSHYVWGSTPGGGPDPATCKVLDGECHLTDCPELPDPKTIYKPVMKLVPDLEKDR